MKQINYTGSSKLISRIVSLLNRKAPLPLDGNGDPDWGTNGQVLTTDGNGSTSWSSGGGGGDTVSWTQTQLSGDKIAEIDINGTTTEVYAPSQTLAGHTIESTDGTDLPQEDNLQFVGVYTRDDSVNSRTEVNIVRQMTKAAMEALSSAEKEGFIDTTDEDDDYIPVAAEDVKRGISDVDADLTALENGKVNRNGDTMTGLLKCSQENKPVLSFRTGNASWSDYMTHYTGGNECFLLSTKNAITSLMFVNGEDSSATTDSNRWMSLTPGLQIKNNKVAIGKLIGNGVTPTYALDVGGTINSSGEITKNGNPVFAPTTFTNTSFTPTDNTRTTLYTNTSGHTQLVFCSVSAEIRTATGIVYLNKNNDGNNPLANAQLTAVDVTKPQYQHVTLTCFVQLANGDAIKYYPVVAGGTLGNHSVVLAY